MKWYAKQVKIKENEASRDKMLLENEPNGKIQDRESEYDIQNVCLLLR